MKKSQERGLKYEKEQARKHGAKHIGGPGKEDFRRGRTKGEVKNWKRPVHSGVVKDATKKGIRKIVSKSGFTEPAQQLAQKKGIKLTSGGRTKRR